MVVRQTDEVNYFAFVIHPLDVHFIHEHPWFRWSRFLPDWFVETVGAWFPPLFLSRMRGGQSQATGQRIEGFLYTLGATPRQMMGRNPEFTYRRLVKVARMAEQHGARILGLGAFTSVIGDGGISVARSTEIGITTGNSLTVVATLEAAKQALERMGLADLSRSRVMVVGATGSIGSICARLLAPLVHELFLVSLDPERLSNLEVRILEETPLACVMSTLTADDQLGDCDLIITATSAFGQRVLDVTRCKPGAVICDVALPPDIHPAEAALRPDVLVIQSGEIRIPGKIDFGYDMGLPPNVAYACLAETILLALEGRFEDYTLGREISVSKVQEIERLFKKHMFELAGLQSFGKFVTDEEIDLKRQFADNLCSNPALFDWVKQEAAARLDTIPPNSKGSSAAGSWQKCVLTAAGLGVIAWVVSSRKSKNSHPRQVVEKVQ